jgi:hypothetical protein
MIRPIVILVGLGLLLLGLTIGGMALDLPHSPHAAYQHRVNLLVSVLVTSALAYGAAVLLVLRRVLPSGAFWFVLGLALLLRLLLLFESPALSSDIFRYVWDGRVQAAGINPYRFVPADPALAGLRDSVIYPSINRADYARTIYPPFAQLFFGIVGRIADGVTAIKLGMLGFEALGIGCLLALLARAKLPQARILIYAWNPLVLWSFASDGHVDAMTVGLLGLGLLLRLRNRQGWAGVALAGAVLAKFLPLAVAPALLRGGRFWPPALAGSAVIITLYAAYSGVGWHVLGFLPDYRIEEGLEDGSNFWLLSGLDYLLPLPPAASSVYLAVAAVGLVSLALAIARARPAPGDAVALCRDAGVLMLITMLVLSPRYAWYFAWLALPATIAPSPALLWLATASVLFYVDPWNDRFLWPALVYIPTLGLLAAGWWRRRDRGGAGPGHRAGTRLRNAVAAPEAGAAPRHPPTAGGQNRIRPGRLGTSRGVFQHLVPGDAGTGLSAPACGRARAAGSAGHSWRGRWVRPDTPPHRPAAGGCRPHRAGRAPWPRHGCAPPRPGCCGRRGRSRHGRAPEPRRPARPDARRPRAGEVGARAQLRISRYRPHGSGEEAMQEPARGAVGERGDDRDIE